jgi:hypothetical protein
VKIAARLVGARRMRRLARLEEPLAASALDAAAEVLGHEAERAREAAGVAAPLSREWAAGRLLIGTRDPAAVALELGTLDRPPAPWLAPVFPTARAKMRAEVKQAVAQLLSQFRK